MHKHILSGCRTRPLSSYLKAVAILRLVAEQKDPGAKGYWQEDTFIIETNLDDTALQDFFCNEYAPTPIVAPWNGGSGFYLGDSMDAMEAILSSDDPRFYEYRRIISQIQTWPEIPKFNTVADVAQRLEKALDGMREGKKRKEIEDILSDTKSPPPDLENLAGKKWNEFNLEEVESSSKQGDNPQKKHWKTWWSAIKKARTKCNTIMRTKNKTVILPLCRARLPETGLKWIDAVYSLQSDGSPSFNPVLGTGGNEGRLELSNNFMKRLTDLLIKNHTESTRSLLKAAVFDEATAGLSKGKIGQYDPGRAGGYNQGMEVETKDFKINPWDYILTLEGALVLAGAVVRRNPTDDRSHFTAPFTVRFSSVGFTSSSHEEAGRSETWLPVWRNPASYSEIKYLFGEGRTSVGRKSSRTGIDFSRAVGTLGVDRGIDSFERYVFLERRGQNYAAVPSGRMRVRYRPQLHLLNELDPIVRSISGFLRGFPNIPATFESCRQNIDEAIFNCCQVPDAHRFVNLVRQLGRLERIVAQRDRTKKPKLERPLYGLSPRWILQCDDGSIELRVAAALASIQSTDKVGPIRSYMAGVSPSNRRIWDKGKGASYWYGPDLTERLCGVLFRRLMDAERTSASRVPIEGYLSLSPGDLMPFLWGSCDNTKIEELLWGFTLINWHRSGAYALRKQWKEPLTNSPLSRLWCLLKLLHQPGEIRDITIKREPRVVHLLSAGRVREAAALAIHRLRISDLHPFDVTYEEDINPKRLLASLLVPTKNQWQLESLVLQKPTRST